MKFRQVVAATGLTVLVALSVVTPTEQRVARPIEPAQWAYAVGMSGEEALAYSIGSTVACGIIGGVGGVACGITAAF